MTTPEIQLLEPKQNDMSLTQTACKDCWDKHPYHRGTKLVRELVEFIARKAVECTCNTVILDINKVNEDTADQTDEDKEWMEIIYNIRANNNIEQWVKGIIRSTSLYGKAYPYFDIDENGNILLSMYIDHWLNHTVKYKQYKEFVATGVKQLFKPKFYFGSYVAEQRTFNENTLFPILNNNIQTIPNWIFNFDIPETIKKELVFGTYETNYGFLSVKEILNKNRIDFQMNDYEMCDTYPAWEWLDSIDIIKTFMDDEPRLDHSMQFGTFDYTTLANKLSGKTLGDQFGSQIARTPNTPEHIDSIYSMLSARDRANADPFIAKKYFNLRGQNPQVEILHTNFDGTKHFSYMNSIYDFICNISGYSFSYLGQQAMRTSAGVMSLSKRDYETTRDKVNLFQNQIMEFLQRVFGAYFRLKYQNAEVGDFAYTYTKDKIKFNIVSNLINEYLSKTDDNIANYKAGLKSQEQAIMDANQDKPYAEVETQIQELKEETAPDDEAEVDENDENAGKDNNVIQSAEE